uniref:Methionine aminopeptidase n=1 Tax=Anopheles epiroticus TaxID=199890 RepID=A0A182PEC6_9DIPT
MDRMIILFFTMLPLAVVGTDGFKTERLLVDFITLKHCQHVIIFDCVPVKFAQAYVLSACRDRGTLVRFIDISANASRHNVAAIFPPTQYAKLCAVLDFTCPEAAHLLDEVSNHRYLNNTVSWMLLARNATGPSVTPLLHRTLWSTSGIQLNSDLITALETAEQGVFNLFDVYSKGRHLCKDIYQTLRGRWSTEGGFNLTPNYSPYKIRQNFNFLQLRGVTVIDRENVTSDQVDRMLSEPGLTKGIVAFVKYHYALLVVLRDFHNFTIKYRPTRGWAGRLRSGYRLGLLGVVQRHETDVAATGIIMRLSRQPELDSIHYSWAFETGFIYKITPDIGSKSEGNGFVAPFSPSVWVAFLLSLALSVAVLRYLACRRSASHPGEPPARATMAYVLDVMACVAQQGVPNVSRLVPMRIATIVLLVANLVLYNYYTSTVVSGLLSAKMIGPESIPQVIDSPLRLSLTDTGYHRILLREQTLPYSARMHERKALPPRSPTELPLFTDVEHAVPFLRRGGHVLHCELTEVYPAIANQFTANEICELRTVEGLYRYDIRVMAFVLPKHSMYGEMFKITLMRAQETGVVKRIYRIHKIAKPICQGSATVYSVELTEVSLAFIILGGCKKTDAKRRPALRSTTADAATSAPIYADVRTAVRLLKQGGYAFHCELTEAFQELANHFDAKEICELRTAGVTTDEIDAFVHQEAIKANAYPSPLRYLGFPKSVCTSVNNVACHGIPDDRKLLDGDIINIDITVFFNGYHGDCSRTVLIGEVDERGKYLVESTERCLAEAILCCGPGQPICVIGKSIDKFAKRKKLTVMPAFAGHGIGSYFHGPPNILHFDNDFPGVMIPGMTFTIEPVLTLGTSEAEILEDTWTAVSTDNARSAQFEHTVLITSEGCEVLTVAG